MQETWDTCLLFIRDTIKELKQTGCFKFYRQAGHDALMTETVLFLQMPEQQGPQTKAVPQQQKATWRKKNKDTRVQREYKSAAEVLSAAPAKPLAAQPILDMRGPQARLITNLEHLNVQVRLV
jgi:hypothetical protein